MAKSGLAPSARATIDSTRQGCERRSSGQPSEANAALATNARARRARARRAGRVFDIVMRLRGDARAGSALAHLAPDALGRAGLPPIGQQFVDAIDRVVGDPL